jgi:hypothetical protein
MVNKGLAGMGGEGLKGRSVVCGSGNFCFVRPSRVALGRIVSREHDNLVSLADLKA